MLRESPFRPGVIKDDTVYAAKGYATDSDKIRWVRGRAETMGGWQAETDQTFDGVCRAGKPWAANDGTRYIAFGTHTKLYVFVNARLYDITPLRKVVDPAAADPLATIAGSSIVTVTDAGHDAREGDTVYISRATPVGGVQIGGTTGNYPADPFQTQNGSPYVIVNHPAHGLKSGDFVAISGATAVAGITLSGVYSVSVYGTDFYTVQAATKANAEATGGGTPSYSTAKQYQIVEIIDANSYTIDIGTPAVSTATGGGANVAIRYELSVGNKDAIGTSGYGLGGYGLGPYGIFLGGSTDSEPRIWCLDNWGEFLTANPIGGHLYQWELNVSERAEILANSPDQVLWHVVTAERVIMTCGCTNLAGDFDPLQLRNCDIQNNTVWAPGTDNNARDERLAEGSRVVAARKVRGGTLIWTDTALYYNRFVGQTDQLYSSDPIGLNCGLIGPNSVVAMDGSAYWMSKAAAIYKWEGGAPTPVICPMREWFAKRLAPNQQYKIFAFYDGTNPAVTWLFPGPTTGECDEYMRADLPIIEADPNSGWSNGTFDRTMWFDQGIFENPIATDSTGHIFRQEIGTSADGNAIERHVTYSPVENEDMSRVQNLSRAVFDMTIDSGTPQLLFDCRRWLNGPVVAKGPYNLADVTERTDLKAQGRIIVPRIQSVGTNDSWRVGAPLYATSPGPRR